MPGALPSGGDTSQMTPHPFSILGGQFSALNTRDEPTVRAALTQQVATNPDLNSLSDQVFNGIDSSLGMVAGIFEAILRKMLGIIPFIDMNDPNGPAPQLLNQMDTFFTNWRAFLGDINFLDPDFDPVDAAFSFIELVLSPTGLLNNVNWDDLYTALTGITDPQDALGAISDFLNFNMGGPISAERLPLIPLSHIRNINSNLLVDPDFDDPRSVHGMPDWTHDAVDGYQNPGCISTVANGTTHRLYSIKIDVAPEDELDISFRTKWIGVTAAPNSNAIRVNVIAYSPDNTVLETVMVGGIASPSGSSGNWTNVISGHYPVHDQANRVGLELVVTSDATAGTVKFDTGELRKSGTFKMDYVSGLVGTLDDAAAKMQGIINTAWDAIFGEDDNPAHDLTDLMLALTNIPGTNVNAMDNGNIIDSFQSTWDRLVGGFFRTNTTGTGVADVAQAAATTADTADTALQLGEWNNALLGVRNNKSIMEGIDETEESSFPISDLMSNTADPTSIAVTSASVPLGFWRATQDAKKGFVSWFGKGVTNVTGLFVDIYKMNYATNTLTLLHSSPDQLGQVNASGAWTYCVYNIPTASRIQVGAGDVLAVGFRVTGTGTHTIAAKIGSWFPAHPTVHPQKPGASKTGTGNVAFGSISYNGNLPWFGLGILSGDAPPIYNAPRTQPFTTPGPWTYNVPDWANFVDVILKAGGGGGHGGDNIANRSGEGGGAGDWAVETLVRGVDFPNTTGVVIGGTLGNGGTAGNVNGDGGPGENTTRNAIAGGKAALIALGGAAGDQYDTDSGAGDKTGDAGGSVTWPVGGTVYQGGGTAAGGSSATGQAGSPPGGGGGGGGGGTWGVAWKGGPGARGAVWVVARQS